MSQVISIGSPSGANASTCGYCSPPGGRSFEQSFWKSAGLSALQLSTSVYQRMIDRGWRRSGKWCYKPDNKRTCCPHYVIRLDALEFAPSKSQRKLINQWNAHINPSLPSQPRAKTKGNVTEFKLTTAIHAAELGVLRAAGVKDLAHKFTVTLEPSSFTREKFELYQQYQQDIHKDKYNSEGGFKNFLCDSPLRPEKISYRGERPSHLPENYGSYHQLYRFDGELIAMAVLDILPKCVSSVYFVYLKSWEKFSFGKLSVFREASLAREIHEAGAEEMRYLYMGYYIHSCTKMRYKGEYQPSYLADPETNEWYPLEMCKPLLDKHRYVSFAHPEHSFTKIPEESPDTPSVDANTLSKVQVVKKLSGGTVSTVPLLLSQAWKSRYDKEGILCCIDGLGEELAQEVLMYTYY